MAKKQKPADGQMALIEAAGPIEWIDLEMPVGKLPDTIGPPPEASFVETVRLYGVNVPIQIYRHPVTGEARIIDGNRRLAAARAVGVEKIRAQAIESDSYELALLTLIGNEQRSSNPVAEYWAVTRLMGELGYSEAMVSQHTGMKPATIKRRLRLANLNGDFLLLFEQGSIKTTLAYEIAKLSKDDQARLWDRYVGGEKLSAALVRSVKEVERGSIMDELPDMPEPVWVEHSPDKMIGLIDQAREAVMRGADILEIDRIFVKLEAGIRARVPGATA